MVFGNRIAFYDSADPIIEKRFLVMNFIRTTLTLVTLLLFSGNAHAAILDASHGVGFLNPGDHGEFISGYSGSSYYSEDFYGSLAPNSVLTVSYSLTNALETSLSALAYHGFFSDLAGSEAYADVYGNNTSSSFAFSYLLTVVANLTDPNNGSVIVSNNTSNIVNFGSLVLSYLCGSCNVVRTSYNVTSTPLPAALPLFGLGISALVGARIRRKKKVSL